MAVLGDIGPTLTQKQHALNSGQGRGLSEEKVLLEGF